MIGWVGLGTTTVSKQSSQDHCVTGHVAVAPAGECGHISEYWVMNDVVRTPLTCVTRHRHTASVRCHRIRCTATWCRRWDRWDVCRIFKPLQIRKMRSSTVGDPVAWASVSQVVCLRRRAKWLNWSTFSLSWTLLGAQETVSRLSFVKARVITPV